MFSSTKKVRVELKSHLFPTVLFVVQHSPFIFCSFLVRYYSGILSFPRFPPFFLHPKCKVGFFSRSFVATFVSTAKALSFFSSRFPVLLHQEHLKVYKKKKIWTVMAFGHPLNRQIIKAKQKQKYTVEICTTVATQSRQLHYSNNLSK